MQWSHISLFAHENLEKVSLQLQLLHQFQFAGYYIAKEKGFYADEGLDVVIKEFSLQSNIAPARAVTSDKATYGIGKSSLIISKANGEKIVSLAALLQSSPLVFIINESSKFNISKSFLTENLAPQNIISILKETVFSDLSLQNNALSLNEFKNEKKDLITGYITDQVYELKQQGMKINIFQPKDYGFDFYDDILFTSENEIINHKQRAINFKNASLKGWRYAFSHIEETVDLILKRYNTQNKTKQALIYEANELKKLAFFDTKELGVIDASKIQNIYGTYNLLGFVNGKFDANEFIFTDNKEKINFTKEEKDWIKKHPVLTYSEINWKPLSIIENGKMTGIMGDYLDLVSEKTNIVFKFIPSSSWQNALENFKNNKVDFLPGTSEYANLGFVSDSYKKYPMVIVAGKEFRFVENLSYLKDKVIAVPKNYSSDDFMKKNYPNIKLKTTKDIPEALALVQNGEADAFIGHIATSLYYITKLYLSDLKIVGKTTFEFNHAFLIHKEDSQFLSIINKTLQTLTEQERSKIDSKWIKTTIERKVDYTLVWQILGLTFLLSLLFLHRNRQLTKHNKELKKQKDILYHQAHHDGLTKLPNRALFSDRLQQGIQKAKRNQTELALFFIDLDRFKQINDSLGHEIGDKVLITVTERFKKTIRAEDTLARLGGDEFMIIAEKLKKGEDSVFLAQKILDVMTEPITIAGHTLYVTGSIGISLYPKDDTNATNLLKYADAAMYIAKDGGRNNFQFYSSEMTELAFERLTLGSSLRDAIKNEEFIVYYQPQIDGSTDKLIGMEALVRWQHPTLGIVAPVKFIPFAEETGLIVPIDRLVMKSAMRQISKWYKDGLNPGKLSLNLAMKQLKTDDFMQILKDTISTCNFKAEWLKLEITESAVMQKPKESIAKLIEISKLNISIAIDDFGTGYSSLSYLKRLPISTLKIDKSFIRDIPEDEEDVAIVKATIALANSLNLKLIAEGVENKEQKTFLLENGCKNIQGYFYSKPIPAEEMGRILKKHK